MKKYLIALACAIMFLSAETQIQIIDTVPKYPGDLSISIYTLHNNDLRLFIKKDSSLNLIKEYRVADNRLLLSREIDALGDNHGNYYYYDTLTGSQSFGKFIHDNVMEAYTISVLGDTVYREMRMNDSLVQIIDIRNGFKTVSHVNNNYINNGSYIVTDIRSEQIIKSGEYKAIKETDILDSKKYMFYIDKYGLIYSFRNIELASEIPVGNWHYYDNDGKLKRTEEYTWQGCLRGID